MTAEVSSLVRILSDYKQDQMQGGGGAGSGGGGGAAAAAAAAEPTVLITRDLLGGCSMLGSKELDLDSQAPNGWEKRLDLKSGKMYLHRCESPSEKKSAAGFQDLNYPPNLAEDASLDLKLVPSAESQSVCTLDKVKSALERAKRESTKKRPSVASYGGCSDASSSRIYSSLSSPSSQSSTISIKGGEEEGEVEAEDPKKSSPLVFAAGCPGCLLYVLISMANPRCPRCGAVVPAPVLKKPRLDLNVSV